MKCPRIARFLTLSACCLALATPLSPAAAAVATVKGAVSDGSKQPIAKAAVYLIPAADVVQLGKASPINRKINSPNDEPMEDTLAPNRDKYPKGMTDNKGNFSIPKVADGKYFVYVEPSDKEHLPGGDISNKAMTTAELAKTPLKILKIWEGGLVFYGGFIGAVLFSIYYSWRRGRNFFLVSDVLIPSVALGHFFGRLGCFAAGCCWGGVVSGDFPFAVQYPEGGLAFTTMRNEGLISPDAAHTLHVHPVQLYEAFGELAIFFLLLAVRSRKRFHGQMLLTYLFAYPVLRTTLEFFRGDRIRGVYSVFGVDVSTSQIISTIVAASALGLLAFFVRKRHAEHRALAAPA